MRSRPPNTRRTTQQIGEIKQDPTAAAAPKVIASRYYQLKTGHAAIGAYLQKIKVQENGTCQGCQAPSETVNHLMFECRQWRSQRRTLRGDLIRARVQYPTAAEEAPEERLFGNKKATKALLTYIANTEIGLRRGHALRELERIRKDNEWGIEALEEEREGEG